MKKVIGFSLIAASVFAMTLPATAGDREVSVSVEKVTSPGTGRDLWLVTRTSTRNGVSSSSSNLHRKMDQELLQNSPDDLAVARQQTFDANPSRNSNNTLKVLRTNRKKQRR